MRESAASLADSSTTTSTTTTTTTTTSSVTTTTSGGFFLREPESREVSPGIYAFTENGISHSMFIVSSEGVVVIDPMNTKHATAMLSEIRNITSTPIKYVFYSHNHWDHIGGGQVFKDEGASIVAHKFANEFIEANPNPRVASPDIVWEGDMKSYSLGNITMELHYLGINHGHGKSMKSDSMSI